MTDNSPELLHNTWHIVQTSLKMWRNRSGPTLNYVPLPGGQVGDIVAWRGRSGLRTVIGIDSPDGDGWKWRGTGLITRFTTSRWSFIASDPGGEWAVSHFERTPFTEAGVDLCFRTSSPTPELVEKARAACAADQKTQKFLPLLFAVKH